MLRGQRLAGPVERDHPVLALDPGLAGQQPRERRARRRRRHRLEIAGAHEELVEVVRPGGEARLDEREPERRVLVEHEHLDAGRS